MKRVYLSLVWRHKFGRAAWLLPIFGLLALLAPPVLAEEPEYAPLPENPAARATTADQMQPYTEVISGTDVSFEMLPIPGGELTIGSPEDEEGREADEGPQRKVQISPFWMQKHEVTWDEYDIWSFSLDIQRRGVVNQPPTKLDLVADIVTRPTKPYTDMTFGMGKKTYPAICMTQLAARAYCKWLSKKTGHFYRLPTEAEWEYACRAGTTTAYHFGDDPDELDDYAWYFDNSDDQYQPVGQKKPNPWGLHDMHGNVAEWCLDQYLENGYARLTDGEAGSWIEPTTEYPRVARGGSWDDDPERLRSAARRGSDKSWKAQDPQIPQSVWYFTDALFVGFRVVRPLEVPSEEEQERYWGTAEVPERDEI